MENTEKPETLIDDISHPNYAALGDVIHHYNHCVICGGRLHFIHLTDFSKNLAQEVARCPECNVQARRVMHRLQ